MKICLAFSKGGHRQQMLQIMDAFEEHNTFCVTVEGSSTSGLTNVYFIRDAGKGRGALIKTAILNAFRGLKILLKERPDVIVTTGADILFILICYAGKWLRAKVIYIETIARVNNPSLTGRVLYPISDLFLVQWEPLLKKYGKKAKYWGRVI